MNKLPTQFNIPTIQGFAAILLWSMTVGLVRSVSEQVGTLTSAVVIYFVSGTIGVIAALCRKRLNSLIKSESKKYFLICGTLFTAYMLFFFLAIGRAVDREQVIVAGLLNYLWPVMTLLGSVLVLKKKAKWYLVPATILALSGIFLVIVPDAGSFVSSGFPVSFEIYVWGILAAFSWALYSILAGKLGKNIEKGSVTVFLLATSAVLLFPALLSNERSAWSLGVIVEIMIMSTATYIAYEFWDKAMRKGNVTAVASFSYLTPLFSTVFSAIYLSVMPPAALWTGCAILIAGSFLSWRSVSS